MHRANPLLPELHFNPFRSYISELGLSYEITSDAAEIFDYLFIRSECYKEELGIHNIPVLPDSFDGVGIMAVIKKDGQVVGGARTIVSRPGQKHLLPLEKEGFCVSTALPELALEQHSYCEMSGIAILPDYRFAGAGLEYLIRFIFEFLERERVMYLFSHAPILQTRIYRKITTNLGYNFTILKDIEMPLQKLYASLEKVYLAIMPFNQQASVAKSENGANAGVYTLISKEAA